MALNKEIVKTFKKAFEEDCIELIIHAYTIALIEKKYQLDWMENDFSELLANYVNESQLSIDKRICCKTENKLFSNAGVLSSGYADKLPRIDFVYSTTFNNNRYENYMEAKRLKQNDSGLKRAYINEGIDRFVSKKYPLGCVLAYLLEGKIDETIKGINSLLLKDKRDTETLNLKNNNFLKSYYESKHNNIGVLKHLVFDFTRI